LSRIDLEKLRDEFAKRLKRKATALQDIRDIVEQKLAEMLAQNPSRMDYQRKYEEIVADYNKEKDRTTIEVTFRRLTELVESLDEELRRATREVSPRTSLPCSTCSSRRGSIRKRASASSRPAGSCWLR
jgi:type I restriction enzyme R subunit